MILAIIIITNFGEKLQKNKIASFKTGNSDSVGVIVMRNEIQQYSIVRVSKVNSLARCTQV